jgi:hypothetical protein
MQQNQRLILGDGVLALPMYKGNLSERRFGQDGAGVDVPWKVLLPSSPLSLTPEHEVVASSFLS